MVRVVRSCQVVRFLQSARGSAATSSYWGCANFHDRCYGLLRLFPNTLQWHNPDCQDARLNLTVQAVLWEQSAEWETLLLCWSNFMAGIGLDFGHNISILDMPWKDCQISPYSPVRISPLPEWETSALIVSTMPVPLSKSSIDVAYPEFGYGARQLGLHRRFMTSREPCKGIF